MELREELENTVRYFKPQLFDATAQAYVIPIARVSELSDERTVLARPGTVRGATLCSNALILP